MAWPGCSWSSQTSTPAVAALKRSFQGSAHQRCRVHFARNLLAHVPKTHADVVAAVFRTIFAQPYPEAVSKACEEIGDQVAPRVRWDR